MKVETRNHIHCIFGGNGEEARLAPKRGRKRHRITESELGFREFAEIESMVTTEEEATNGGVKLCRPSLKTHPSFNNYPSLKHKLRENCFKRVREDRNRLFWKFRLANKHFPDDKDGIKSTFQDIVSDELRKINGLPLDESPSCADVGKETDDMIWEYDGLHTAYQGDCEEILLEMQRIFYEDIRTEESMPELSTKTWEEEEDEYLALLVYEHMQLKNEEEGKKVLWCPICKQGKLQENDHHISCSQCDLRLERDEEVNLEFLQLRLAEAHTEHFERGCRLKPEFCMETKFEFTALYIKCQGCNTFEVVL